MKILIIICNAQFKEEYLENIIILKNFLNEHEVEWCGIFSNDDFYHLEKIINFNYKIIDENKQLSKICKFITDFKSQLNYDWYIKFRPDLKLLEPINFDSLLPNSINARARVYNGPKCIEYGCSVGGKGSWSHIKNCNLSENENFILDDMLYIFDQNIINNNGFQFKKLNEPVEQEWVHTSYWKNSKINLNVIGLNLINMKYNGQSGHINL